MAREIRVEGAKELRRALRRAGADLADLKAINRAAAEIVVPTGKAMSPVSTPAPPPKTRRRGRGRPRVARPGRLRSTIRVSATARAGVIKAGGYGVKYAGPIHWGWRAHNIRPRPWLSQAAQATEPAWTRAYEAKVKTTLRKYRL